MLRLRSVEQAEERARGDFVHALLHGRFTNTHDLEARAKHYDFPTDARYAVVVAGGPEPPSGPDRVTAMFRLAREVATLVPRADMHTLATVVGDTLAIVRQVEPADRRGRDHGRDVTEYVQALEAKLQRHTGKDTRVAYGRPVDGAEKLQHSYREARITLNLMARLGLDQPCSFRDLRVLAVLFEVASTETGRDFAAEILTPLRRANPGASELGQAVQAYIKCGGNVNAAARQLHVHRNTMLYKLDRASRVLQLDLRQPEHRFAVELASKIDVLASTAAAIDREIHP